MSKENKINRWVVRENAYGIHPRARQPQMARVTSSGPRRYATWAR